MGHNIHVWYMWYKKPVVKPNVSIGVTIKKWRKKTRKALYFYPVLKKHVLHSEIISMFHSLINNYTTCKAQHTCYFQFQVSCDVTTSRICFRSNLSIKIIQTRPRRKNSPLHNNVTWCYQSRSHPQPPAYRSARAAPSADLGCRVLPGSWHERSDSPADGRGLACSVCPQRVPDRRWRFARPHEASSSWPKGTLEEKQGNSNIYLYFFLESSRATKLSPICMN